jgi:hypothetical protein
MAVWMCVPYPHFKFRKQFTDIHEISYELYAIGGRAVSFSW